MRRVRLTRLWLVVVVAATSVNALGQTPAATAAEAKKHFQRSKDLYEEGDFAGSLREVERSYAMVPNYKLLFNIGQIHAQTQDYAAALKSFKKFLVDGGDDIAESRRADVLKEVDRLRTRVAELTIIVNQPGADVAIDDVPVGVSPLPGPVTVNVGRRKVTATVANHFPFTKLVEVAGLDQANVKVDLTPLVTTPVATTTTTTTTEPGPALVVVAPTPVAKPFRLPVWLPWVGAGALAAGAGVVSALAFQSSGSQRQLVDMYGVTRAALDAAATRTRTMAMVADGLWAGTAAVGVAALLYTFLRSPDDPPEPQGTLTLIPTGSSVTLVTTW